MRGWPAGAPIDSQECVEFAQIAGVRTRVDRFRLDQVQEAYDAMASGMVRFRAVLVF